MNPEKYFGRSYQESREKFLLACESNKINVEKCIHPLSAESSIELAADVVYLGQKDADKLLVLTSGVHGPELMCGSGCQTGHIETGDLENLPGDTGVLIIHSLNPWGAANLRRNDENNIDLARNFIDFDKALPVNEFYSEVHQILSLESHEELQANLKAYIAEHGRGRFMSALMGGQYSYPNGFSYGGSEPAWSNLLFRRVLKQHGRCASRICHIDYHTAIGPYGYGMAVCMQNGITLERARNWFGDWIVAPREEQSDIDSEGYSVTGHPSDAVMEIFPEEEKEVVSVVLEFGTYDAVDINLPAMVDDHWLTFHGDTESQHGQQVKEQMLKIHAPDDPAWRCAVWSRSRQVLRQALDGLLE